MRTLFILLLLSALIHPIVAQEPCVKPSRVTIGETARVTPGDSNNVRSEPNDSAESVGRIAGGDSFTVLNNPYCGAQYVWIEIQTEDFTGWTVEATADEYWIQPITGEIYENEFVSIMIPDDLTDDVTLTIEEKTEVMWADFPIRVVGEIASDAEAFRSPRLIVAPIAEFENVMVDFVQDAVDDLTTLKDTEADFSELILETVDPSVAPAELTFPADPFIIGARRMLVVSPHFVEMTNGWGIGFVTMYAQDILPATNDRVFYNFVGITADNNYLVTFRYPVTSDMLIGQQDAPNLPFDWDARYVEYIRQATESLNTVEPDGWQPSLDVLDEVIGSIYVVGGFE